MALGWYKLVRAEEEGGLAIRETNLFSDVTSTCITENSIRE
jgi:hypothetical protein